MPSLRQRHPFRPRFCPAVRMLRESAYQLNIGRLTIVVQQTIKVCV